MQILAKQKFFWLLWSVAIATCLGCANGLNSKSPQGNSSDTSEVAGEGTFAPFKKWGVIYGSDTRQENTLQFKDLAAAVAVVVPDYRIELQSHQTYRLKTQSYKDFYGLCEGHRFQEQPVLGVCTATLIAEDLVLTASHCLDHRKRCEGLKFIFGWDWAMAQSDLLSVDQVYSCAEVVSESEDLKMGADFAILKLDRPVPARPLKIGEKISRSSQEELYSFSYPHGLPLKIDRAQNLKAFLKPSLFRVDVDTFQGSSGSPLINSQGEIVGILSRGSEDFVEEKDPSILTCRQVKSCLNGECYGETFYDLEDLRSAYR